MAWRDVERAAVADAYIALAELRGVQVSDRAVDLALTVLEDYDPTEVIRAILALARDGVGRYDARKIPPQPSEILERIETGGQSAEDAAAEAWADVASAIGRFGRYNKPAFDETTERALAAIGGWTALCDSPEDRLPVLRRAFCESYSAALKRRRADATPPALKPGKIDRLTAGIANRKRLRG